MPELLTTDLERISYQDALDIQRRLLEEAQASPGAPARLLLLEHDPPVITLGRRARDEHLLLSRERIEAQGVEIHKSDRGGDVTFHGPGQLVAYPVVRLDPRKKTVHEYVHNLEESLIRLLARYEITAHRKDKKTGVWVGENKIAAIGVAVRKWVAFHGVALNVADDLAGFDLIVPCGLRENGITSISRTLGRSVSMKEVKKRFVESVCEVFGFDSVREVPPHPVNPAPPSAGANRKPRLPHWLRRKYAAGPRTAEVRSLLNELGLSTVCEKAHCPNIAECYERRTATFMILGDRCTRACRFCAVDSDAAPLAVRPDEPEAVAEACERLGLRHVVITSVTRDDLPDGGAAHFARVCRAVRDRLPGTVVEILTPDFQGNARAVDALLEEPPDIFNHNVETVPRLYSAVRPQADYERSLSVLDCAKRRARDLGLDLHTKSGVMVGLGETREELRDLMGDLRRVECDILTVGQYLAPSSRHIPVARFVEPGEFAEIESEARALGFRAVASGPFVRSSYHAEQVFLDREGCTT